MDICMIAIFVCVYTYMEIIVYVIIWRVALINHVFMFSLIVIIRQKYRAVISYTDVISIYIYIYYYKKY